MPSLSNHFSRIMLVGAVLGCFAAGRASAEDAVLLNSTVPGYVPGMVISSADRLSVPDGASATLLFQSGEMLRLRGPFEGTLGQRQSGAASGGAAMLAEMFRMQGADATVIGGTRSTSLARSGPVLDDVEVDPQRSGTYCVEQATSVWITRPAEASDGRGSDGRASDGRASDGRASDGRASDGRASDGRASDGRASDGRASDAHTPDGYALRRKGSSRTLGWPAGAARIEWPSDVPIEDGSQFEITTGGSALATVTFRAIASDAGGEAKIASGLVLGCRDQFDVELKRLSRSVAAPELWLTTDHGRHPLYHAGEAIGLTVMANVDGYLYCFAVGGDGGVRAMFPAGALDGAQLRGSSPLSIPGRRQPAGLVAAAGTAQVRCWLADRDITPELPHALLGVPSVRLPDQLAGDLDGLFARIDGTRIERDVVTLQIE